MESARFAKRSVKERTHFLRTLEAMERHALFTGVLADELSGCALYCTIAQLMRARWTDMVRASLRNTFTRSVEALVPIVGALRTQISQIQISTAAPPPSVSLCGESLDADAFVRDFQGQVQGNYSRLEALELASLRAKLTALSGNLDLVRAHNLTALLAGPQLAIFRELTGALEGLSDDIGFLLSGLGQHLSACEMALTHLPLSVCSPSLLSSRVFYAKHGEHLQQLFSGEAPSLPCTVPHEGPSGQVRVESVAQWSMLQRAHKATLDALNILHAALPTSFPHKLPNLSTHVRLMI